MQSFSWRAKSPRLTRVTILFSISPQLAIQSRGFSSLEATPPVSPPPPLATAPSPPSSPTPLRRRSKLSSPLQSGNLGVKTHHLFLLLSTKTLSKISILWQKNRGDSKSLPHPLRLGRLRFRGAGLWKIVRGPNDELEGYSGDEQITLIELTEGGFEDFGGENGGRPYVAILSRFESAPWPRTL